MNRAFTQARLTATEKAIVAYEEAFLAFATNGTIQTYKLDTGQTVSTVTRANLTEMQKILDSLMNRCIILNARLNGGNSFNMAPGW